MIRLVAMIVFITVGVIVGSVFFHWFARHKISRPLCIGLGVLGAFGGILLADLADVRLLGNLADALLFAVIGSLTVLALNLLLRVKDKSNSDYD